MLILLSKIPFLAHNLAYKECENKLESELLFATQRAFCLVQYIFLYLFSLRVAKIVSTAKSRARSDLLYYDE